MTEHLPIDDMSDTSRKALATHGHWQYSSCHKARDSRSAPARDGDTFKTKLYSTRSI